MKKKCVPQNNAIKIKTPVECPTPIIPIVEGCIDPFTYTWNLAIAQNQVDENKTVVEYFDLILDKGLILPNKDNVCCPDCDINPVYSLSSIDTFLKFAAVLNIQKEHNACCINVEASVESYSNYDVNMPQDYPCCDNDFDSCVSKFGNIVLLDTILDKGIVEVNQYAGNTLLCIIYDLLVNTNPDLFGNSTLTEVFDRILDKGISAYCDDCNVIIASTETFIKWWESTQLKRREQLN